MQLTDLIRHTILTNYLLYIDFIVLKRVSKTFKNTIEEYEKKEIERYNTDTKKKFKLGRFFDVIMHKRIEGKYYRNHVYIMKHLLDYVSNNKDFAISGSFMLECMYTNVCDYHADQFTSKNIDIYRVAGSSLAMVMEKYIKLENEKNSFDSSDDDDDNVSFSDFSPLFPYTEGLKSHINEKLTFMNFELDSKKENITRFNIKHDCTQSGENYSFKFENAFEVAYRALASFTDDLTLTQDEEEGVVFDESRNISNFNSHKYSIEFNSNENPCTTAIGGGGIIDLEMAYLNKEYQVRLISCVDLIIVPTDIGLEHYISKTFDLDFLKNCYIDGKLHIFDINSVYTKTSPYYFHHKKLKVGTDEVSDEVEPMERLHSRILKYENRNFNISYVEFDEMKKMLVKDKNDIDDKLKINESTFEKAVKQVNEITSYADEQIKKVMKDVNKTRDDNDMSSFGDIKLGESLISESTPYNHYMITKDTLDRKKLHQELEYIRVIEMENKFKIIEEINHRYEEIKHPGKKIEKRSRSMWEEVDLQLCGFPSDFSPEKKFKYSDHIWIEMHPKIVKKDPRNVPAALDFDISDMLASD